MCEVLITCLNSADIWGVRTHWIFKTILWGRCHYDCHSADEEHEAKDGGTCSGPHGSLEAESSFYPDLGAPSLIPGATLPQTAAQERKAGAWLAFKGRALLLLEREILPRSRQPTSPLSHWPEQGHIWTQSPQRGVGTQRDQSSSPGGGHTALTPEQKGLLLGRKQGTNVCPRAEARLSWRLPAWNEAGSPSLALHPSPSTRLLRSLRLQLCGSGFRLLLNSSSCSLYFCPGIDSNTGCSPFLLPRSREYQAALWAEFHGGCVTLRKFSAAQHTTESGTRTFLFFFF